MNRREINFKKNSRGRYETNYIFSEEEEEEKEEEANNMRLKEIGKEIERKIKYQMRNK